MSTSASSSAAAAVTTAASAVAFVFATGASSTAAVAASTSSAFASSTMSAALAATIAAAFSSLATVATINPPATSALANSGAATSSAPSPAASFNVLAAPIPAAASSLAPAIIDSLSMNPRPPPPPPRVHSPPLPPPPSPPPLPLPPTATTADTGILSMPPAAISAAAIPSTATFSAPPTARATLSAVTIAAAASSLAIAATASLSVPPPDAVVAAAASSSATAFVVAATVATSSSTAAPVTAAPVTAAEIAEDVVVSAGGTRGTDCNFMDFHSHEDVTFIAADKIMIDGCHIILFNDGDLYELDDEAQEFVNWMGFSYLRATDDIREDIYGALLSDQGISVHTGDGTMTYVPCETLFVDANGEPPITPIPTLLAPPLPVLELGSNVDEPVIDRAFLSEFASSPGQTSVQIRDVVRSAFELAFTMNASGQSAQAQILADYLVDQYPDSAVAHAARAVLYCWTAHWPHSIPNTIQFLLTAKQSAERGSLLAPESCYMMWLRASILCDLGCFGGDSFYSEARDMCNSCLEMQDKSEDELVFDVTPPGWCTQEIPAPTHAEKIERILSMCKLKHASPFWFDRFSHQITRGHQKEAKILEDKQEKHQP